MCFWQGNSAQDVLYSPVPPVGALQFVQVVIQSWNSFLETLALACVDHNLSRLAAGLHGISRKDLPVIKHTLWEGLARGVGTKVSSEAFKGGKKKQEVIHNVQ